MSQDQKKILIKLNLQRLEFYPGDGSLQIFPISSGKNGIGQMLGSEKTPLGQHMIYRKLGADLALNTVFIARKPSGEIYSADWAAQYPGRDWILTRILWLMGLEPGYNRFGDYDTRLRHIYIHGTPDETRLGQPGSRGCIRMKNADIVHLFEQVEEGTRVELIA